VIGTHKVSSKPSPAGEGPVEVLFLPGATPPIAYVTNMYGGTLSAAAWNPATKDFAVSPMFDFGTLKAGVPLEMYFNAKGDRLYVMTAKSGHLDIFDVSSPKAAWLLKSLPGMSDGSVTIVDLTTEEVVGSMDTLKKMGLNPNSIVLLPQWNHPAGR